MLINKALDNDSRLKDFVKRIFLRGVQKKQLHFLHIGKTGGTAIKYALKESHNTGTYQMHFHPHNIKLTDIAVDDKVMFVLRNPISRFISGFFSRYRQGQPRHHSPWSPAEKIAFEQFPTPNQLALALSSSDTALKGAAEDAMRSIEHVRDSYWLWFDNDAYFKDRAEDVLCIGFQESLDDDFDDLRQLLGLSDAVQLPANDLDSHRSPNGFDKHLDQHARENLRLWYAEDYRFIELCKDLI